MKDDNINKFFKDHKQSLQNEGFNERLFAHLDCLPAPAPKVDRTGLIISIFALFGVSIFIILGGHKALIDGLSSMGSLFGDYKLIKPEVVVPVMFVMCSLVALIKYALQEKLH
jgi:hypothetical protein